MTEFLPSISTLAAVASTQGAVVTIAIAIAAGVALMIIAERLSVPAIVLLLAGGVVLGPEVIGLVKPAVLGPALSVIVSFAVGIILFEGGLTLDVSGYRTAPAMIKRLLSVGVLTTWLLTAFAIWWIVDLEREYALLAASLVIVTGPTVIAPLLKRIKIHSRLHSILHWEGVLIDPIGVFVALLCFEYVVSGATGMAALGNLGVRISAGLGIGVAGGFGLSFIVKRHLVPEEMINIFALGSAILVFGLAEAVLPEAGLLAVTIAGFIFGLSGSFQLKRVRQFKGELTELLIGTLFILLSARLTFDQFTTFGLKGYLVVALVMVVVRPVNIFLCGLGLDFTLRERAFLSWVAPRGIVAASMASLFAISMTASAQSAEGGPDTAGIASARFVETFTYSVIISTIVLQGLTAGLAARVLRLRRPDPTGWLVIGAHAFGRRVAEFLNRTGELDCLLVDTNPRAVRLAEDEGLNVLLADARESSLQDRDEFQAIGNVLALTDNEDLNIRLCEIWSEVVGNEHVFRGNPTGGEPAAAGEETSPAIGQVVMAKLPKPTLVASELNRGEATILRGAANVAAFGQLASPLITIEGSRVVFRRPDDETTDLTGPTFYLQRAADYLRRSVRPELITTTDATDMRGLFEHILNLIMGVYPNLARDEILGELLDRETTFPTALGHGVAVPHAYSTTIDSRLCVIVRAPRGIDFRAHDKEPVRLVFFVLSPTGDPEGHLATLADIARRLVLPEIREALVDAESPLEVLRVLNRSA